MTNEAENRPFISEIMLGEDFNSYSVSSSESKGFGPLAKINIIVGENNSGKSRFLRLLSKSDLHFAPQILTDVNSLIGEVKEGIATILGNGVYDANQFFGDSLKLTELTSITEKVPYLAPLKAYLQKLSTASGSASDVRQWNSVKANEVKKFGQSFLDKVNRLPESFSFPKLYIPTLRGLRDVGNGTDVYSEKTCKDYFNNSKSPPNVFSGLTLYTEYKRMLLGTFQKRKRARDFESFLQDSFFNGRQLTLIPSEETNTLEIKLGNEIQRPISHLGEGMHSIILMIFPLFQQRDERLVVFFEEPELFLHPAFQRQFLDTLGKKFPNHQYFLSTHSNHFLDITADMSNVSVFTFRRRVEDLKEGELEQNSSFLIENVSNDCSHTLELLGVRNSSVFLSNCTIWVEGITDRRYLAHFLKLLFKAESIKQFKEDLHFSFVEYQGNNITHWSFLDDVPDAPVVERLCGKLFLVCDSDEASPSSKKGVRFEKLKEKLKDRFAALPCREIENLLPPDAIRGALTSYGEKPENFKQFGQEDYRSQGLGTFIEEKILSKPFKRKSGYAADSGTIKDKVNFCSEALSHMNIFENLSEEAKNLTRRIYEFIKDNNK